MTEWKESEKAIIDGLMDRALHGWRSPVLKNPSTVGLKFEEVFFPAMDGVPLEGWFIPADSNKLVICNHFWPGNRYGFAGHLEEYSGFGGFEVNFLNYYKKLHDAGFNILAYDHRNHGTSGDGNGRTFGLGLFEYRDVIGSIRYANSRKDTSAMSKGIMGICLGCNSTIIGLSKFPDEFEDVKCVFGLQPVSARPFLTNVLKSMHLEKPLDELVEYADHAYYVNNGFRLDDLSPIEYCKDVKLPFKLSQLRADYRTDPSDVQNMYDHLGSKEKEIYWIEGSNERFTAYNHFASYPEILIEWFNKYLV